MDDFLVISIGFLIGQSKVKGMVSLGNCSFENDWLSKARV